MSKIREHIQDVVYQVKQSLGAPSIKSVSEESESLHETRANKLDQDKQKLLQLFRSQENEFKSKEQSLIEENDKTKNALSQSLGNINTLTTTIDTLEKDRNDLKKKILSVQSQLETTVKDFGQLIQTKDQEIVSWQQQIEQDKDEIEKLVHQNDDEKLQLEKSKADLNAQMVKYAIEVASIENKLEITEQKLRLKEEEIYEIKESYEKQINDLELAEKAFNPDIQDKVATTKLIKLIPDFNEGQAVPRSTGVITKEEKLKNLEIKKINQSLKDYQDKVKNLSDELYAARDHLLSKDAEINRLNDLIKQNEADFNSLKIEIDIYKDKNSVLNQKLTEVKNRNDMISREVTEAVEKITLFKKQIESDSSGLNKQSFERQGTETSKLISKLMNVLMKAKKVHELKDDEFEKMNKENL